MDDARSSKKVIIFTLNNQASDFANRCVICENLHHIAYAYLLNKNNYNFSNKITFSYLTWTIFHLQNHCPSGDEAMNLTNHLCLVCVNPYEINSSKIKFKLWMMQKVQKMWLYLPSSIMAAALQIGALFVWNFSNKIILCYLTGTIFCLKTLPLLQIKQWNWPMPYTHFSFLSYLTLRLIIFYIACITFISCRIILRVPSLTHSFGSDPFQIKGWRVLRFVFTQHLSKNYILGLYLWNFVWKGIYSCL